MRSGVENFVKVEVNRYCSQFGCLIEVCRKETAINKEKLRNERP